MNLTSDQKIALSIMAEEGGGTWSRGRRYRLRSDDHMETVVRSLIPLDLVIIETPGAYALTRRAFHLRSRNAF